MIDATLHHKNRSVVSSHWLNSVGRFCIAGLTYRTTGNRHGRPTIRVGPGPRETETQFLISSVQIAYWSSHWRRIVCSLGIPSTVHLLRLAHGIRCRWPIIRRGRAAPTRPVKQSPPCRSGQRERHRRQQKHNEPRSDRGTSCRQHDPGHRGQRHSAAIGFRRAIQFFDFVKDHVCVGCCLLLLVSHMYYMSFPI